MSLESHGDAGGFGRALPSACNRPASGRLEMFEGKGISYWASPIEVRLCAGEEVALVGGVGEGAAVVAQIHKALAAQPAFRTLR